MGKVQVVLNLIDKGAYINTTNKKGENILITAVKAGHREIVEALLDKHVEIDAIGNLGKTPIHYAIEKGNFEILQSLLSRKPDLEIANKDGDTPLLLATKKKSTNIVSELLDHGSKISPVDKNGDNVLHISLRNRSHEITELILSNPKNSKYLYKQNKKGVTPYKIDSSNPKSILTQIFGARHLNMAEDGFMGYDLYSGALAEILSEPSLHTPITVGLYAKWGSGKSFLLAQLKSEMKSFAKLTQTIRLQFDMFLLATLLFFNLLFVIPFCFWIWSYGLVLFSILSSLTVFAVVLCKFFYEKREKAWARRACDKLSAQIEKFKLILQVLFMNPLNYKNENLEHKSLR
jgi:ankyrin repeat-rich membrane spanning protein